LLHDETGIITFCPDLKSLSTVHSLYNGPSVLAKNDRYRERPL
jgi:hypothetical protein